jgi:hypothetical protein
LRLNFVALHEKGQKYLAERVYSKHSLENTGIFLYVMCHTRSSAKFDFKLISIFLCDRANIRYFTKVGSEAISL